MREVWADFGTIACLGLDGSMCHLSNIYREIVYRVLLILSDEFDNGRDLSPVKDIARMKNCK